MKFWSKPKNILNYKKTKINAIETNEYKKIMKTTKDSDKKVQKKCNR